MSRSIEDKLIDRFLEADAEMLAPVIGQIQALQARHMALVTRVGLLEKEVDRLRGLCAKTESC